MYVFRRTQLSLKKFGQDIQNPQLRMKVGRFISKITGAASVGNAKWTQCILLFTRLITY